MSGTVRYVKLETRTSRARLRRGREPHWRSLAVTAGRAHLGWQRRLDVCAPGKWLLRRFIDGKYSICTLGWADDLKEADGESVLSFAQAETKAKTMLLAPAARSAPQIAEKFATFQEQGIVPACHLYRHYDPTGDLLYVGISLDNLKRQYEHSREAAWRSMIFQIIVEPFATREEALEAEEQAIRTEFPKYNVTHNGHRHPFQEFAAFERSRARRDKPSKSGNSYSR